jgi:hypothetical protein
MVQAEQAKGGECYMGNDQMRRLWSGGRRLVCLENEVESRLGRGWSGKTDEVVAQAGEGSSVT